MNKSFLTISVIVILASLITLAFFGLNSVNTTNAGLSSNMSRLQDDYDALQSKYYALLGDYSTLEYNYQNILLQSPSMVPNPGSGSPDTQQMLSRYQALQQLYSDLQAEYNEYISNYQKLKRMTDLRLMRADLKALVTPDDPAVVSLVRNITGKVGNDTDSGSYWKDIKAMYDWVTTNIKYREDSLYPVLPNNPADAIDSGLEQVDQMAQFANETLRLREGDCEDQSILLTSMLRAYFNKEFFVENIWVTGANAGDVAVVIPFSNDKITILNPTRGYFSHDTLGNIAANSVSSEMYDWLNVWRPSLGNDVHVYRVFSDYIDKYFNSTEQYINWMYNNRTS